MIEEVCSNMPVRCPECGGGRAIQDPRHTTAAKSPSSRHVHKPLPRRGPVPDRRAEEFPTPDSTPPPEVHGQACIPVLPNVTLPQGFWTRSLDESAFTI